MTLRPLAVTRIANMLVGAPVLACGISTLTELPAALAWLILLVGALLMVRGYRTEVTVNPDYVTVRGYLWTREVPRRAIHDLTPFPALRWTGPSGRARWTPLWMFMTSGSALAFINAHQDYCMDQLRRELRL